MNLGSDSLSTMLVPSRAAASKARTAIGRQLTSSPEPEVPRKRQNTKRKLARSNSTKSITAPSRATQPPPPSQTPLLHKAASEQDVTSEDEDLPKMTGPFVWVRVSRSGEIAPVGSEVGSSESFWWPGSIMSGSLTQGPVHVQLFGRISPGTRTDVQLPAPEDSLIRDMKTEMGFLPFNMSNFICQDTNIGIQESLPPKLKAELERRFRTAVDRMIAAEARQNDGLPSSLSSYAGALSRTSSTLIPAKSENGQPSLEDDLWISPSCDPFLDIPGELVLSKDKKRSTEYWPAKIEEYIAPPSRVIKPLYRLRFLDETLLDLPRSMFYTTDEEGFFSCKLGKIGSAVPINADNIDVDIDEFDLTRGPSPVPEMPPRPNFFDLSIREQFAYVQPVIKAILDDRYPPAKDRHDSFIKGGVLRRTVRKEAPGKGNLTTKEVTELGLVLNRWALRDERYAKSARTESATLPVTASSTAPVHAVEPVSRGEVPTYSTDVSNRPSSPSQSVLSDLTDLTTSPSSRATLHLSTGASHLRLIESVHESPRQWGCEAYEALTIPDKIEYCQLVLLHEAILQLLLWRSGKRTSLDLLGDEEEQELHDVALKQSEEIDWVVEIYRLREAGLKVKPGKTAVVVGGTRSRPKMSSGVRR
ncbi:hypothetical protein HETIRDRAFT_415183 [Heterobasidion irregulare TC 32-1]|uniref:Uncharacterized protein n=1 Tax=Heterobasidion irregulare (strain TC 32-1) TaxID=747525 RepID=W4KKH1_HETIT|nr:uncharacterized protein HETIRDRAFT_415183 [Heterobasidion irregulare TC 32-1]ETW86219.1 hypothetical protein HETIRDRAFT_415183 [Heterobasidion irregulare TC 32-1]